MLPYKYSYLVADLFLLSVWLILLWKRKNLRKEMLTISSIFGLLAPFLETVYILDWWHPITITNTSIGFEDFLFGFTVAGISSAIYEEVFKKRIKLRKLRKPIQKRQNLGFILILAFLAVLFFGSFYFLGVNSFYTSSIAFSVGIILILMKRPDLILDSLVSGILVVLIALFGFALSELITPGFVKALWFSRIFSGILVLNAPIEDLVWFFLCGMFIGPLYEFWKEGKLVS